MKILIVDDNINILNGISKLDLWGKYNLKVITCSDGQTAIEVIKNKNIAIMLTDIRLPGISGLDICEHIYNNGEDIEVIIMSAYQDFKYAQKAIEYRVNSFLTKPVDFDLLENSIVKIINKIKLKQSDNELNYNSVDLIENICNYIHKNVDDAISLDFISEHFGKSPSYISKKFNEKMDVSLPEYLNECRINIAKQKLKNTKDSIKVIAFDIGYSNQRHFLRTFKKYEGCTPSEYRELYTGGNYEF